MMANDGKQPMDALLERLRNGMSDLSSQGDDFTKQMWSMYQTFEDLIVEDSGKRLPTPPGSQAGTMLRDMRPPSSSAGSIKLISSITPEPRTGGAASPAIIEAELNKKLRPTPTPRKNPKQTQQQVKNVSPPGGSTSGYTSDSCSGSCSSIAAAGCSSANPLLDTISTVGESYFSDSDEPDRPKPLLQSAQINPARSSLQPMHRPRRRSHRHRSGNKVTPSVTGNNSSDGDSNGYDYAGSNSIDSGYESFCPPVGGGHCGGLYAHKMAQRLKAQQQDAHLEHLLQLKRSLIAAIARCESASGRNSPGQPLATGAAGLVPSRTSSPVVSSRSASPASTVIAAKGRVRRLLPTTPPSPLVKKPIFPSAQQQQQVLSTINHELYGTQLSMAQRIQHDITVNGSNSGCSSPTMSSSAVCGSTATLNKSVRFDKDIKVTPIQNGTADSKPEQLGGSQMSVQVQVHAEPTPLQSPAMPSGPLEKSKSKSILKDPICDDLRSQLLETTVGQCSLEGEIDSLLYGTERSAAEKGGDLLYAQEDIPYASLIEDKYRSTTKKGESSNGENSGEQIDLDHDLAAQSELAISATLTQALPQRHRPSVGSQARQSQQPQPTTTKVADPNHEGVEPSYYETSSTLSGSPIAKSSGTVALNSTTSTTSTSTTRQNKTRFSEMAKCMLEILDDLQVSKTSISTETGDALVNGSGSSTMESTIAESMSSSESDEQAQTVPAPSGHPKKLVEAASFESNSSSSTDAESAISSDSVQNELMHDDAHINAILDKHLRKRHKAKYEPQSDTSYTSLPEFHIYEEVLYDAMEYGDRSMTGIKVKDDSPMVDDLPPTSFSRNSSARRSAANYSYLNNNSVNYNRNMDERMPVSHGQWSSGIQRAKRSNIYSLFSDAHSRRHISKSLEREYTALNVCAPKGRDVDEITVDETEYGFKASI